MTGFDNCINCGYVLRGHTGSYRCPECRVEYDEQTEVWSSPLGAYHFGNNARVSLIAIIWVLGAGALNLTIILMLGDKASSISKMATTMTSILLLLLWTFMTSRNKRRAISNPFVAVAPSGIVISKSGCAGKFRIISWDEARKGFSTVGRGWGFAEGVAWKLGIALRKEDARELYDVIRKRIGELPPGIEAMRGFLRGMDTSFEREPDRM